MAALTAGAQGGGAQIRKGRRIAPTAFSKNRASRRSGPQRDYIALVVFVSDMLASVAFASIVTHSLFRTDLKDWTINNASSYLDLSPLYGDSE